MSSVKDVFSKEYSTVNETDTLSKCLELFKKEAPPVLAVLDEKGRYVGVIARRWIVRARLDPATAKVKTLMRSAPRIEPDVALSKAAKLMIQSGVRQIPVFEKSKLRGFITDETIIHGAVTDGDGVIARATFNANGDRDIRRFNRDLIIAAVTEDFDDQLVSKLSRIGRRWNVGHHLCGCPIVIQSDVPIRNRDLVNRT